MTLFLLLAFAAVTARLAFLQIAQASHYKGLAEGQTVLAKKLLPSRGEIKVKDKFSQEAYTVATNIQKDLVYAVPPDVSNPKNTAESLAKILNLDAQEVLSKISDTSRKYVPIKRLLSQQEEETLKALRLSGINFEAETVRFYPEKTFLSQVLGFVGFKGDEKVGLYGLEKYFEKRLMGSEGYVNQEKDAGGSWIFGSRRDLQPAVNGDNLILTIDRTIQFKAEEVIKNAVAGNQADSGSIIALDPKTGAVLAMAGYPNYDPNEYYKANEPKVYQNRATLDSYEPGSVFKAMTMAASLDQGKVTPETTYTDTGHVEVDGYVIKNSDGKAHGVRTMTQVLEESLNTGAIFAKEQLGNGEFFQYVKKFGFGRVSGIELPETAGDLSNLSGNINVNYDTASFGQGISVTPIQLVQAYGVLANGGKMMRPYVIASVVSPTGEVKVTQAQELDQVISPKTASVLSAMLVDVVENGHGKKAKVPGYYVAGKTGTAQVSLPGKRGYEPNNNIGSFVGFAPVEDPKFVILVRVNHPRTVEFAETTAAPAFQQLAQFMLNYYNVPPSR